MALYGHDEKSVLGRVGSGTLRLQENQRGLFFEVDLPPTQVARDLAALVERRDVAGASFAFTVPKGGDHWSEVNGKPHRSLLDVSLHEITVTSNPAYVDTTVAKRNLRQHVYVPVRLAHAQRYLETI
jgi:HK97 family phage prohead protease